MTVPKEALAEETRRAIDNHDKWDAFHAFITLHWLEDEKQLVPGTYGAIDPGINPPDYMGLMLGLAEERRKDDEGKDFPPACAYLLQIESFGVEFNPAKATAEEKEKYREDCRNRTFHLRDDAIESVNVWTADVHGRLFAAARIRDEEAVLEKVYWPGRYPGGQLVESLLVVASIGAVKSWGLPVIPGTGSHARTLIRRSHSARQEQTSEG